MEQTQIDSSTGWRRFIKKHAAVFAIFIIAAILAVAGAAYVFGLVPSTLNLWSMNNLVLFILHAIFWELVLIGIPAAIVGIIGWMWWRRIHIAEKSQYNLSTKPSRSSRAGGAISPLLFIAFAIKVYIDGNWNQAIGSYTLDYVVGSMVTILIWIAAIFAIPAIIGLIWWLSRRD
jgi:hypothetical protein